MESDGSWKIESNNYCLRRVVTPRVDQAQSIGGKSWWFRQLGKQREPFCLVSGFSCPSSRSACRVYTLDEREQRRVQEVIRDISSYSWTTLIKYFYSTNRNIIQIVLGNQSSLYCILFFPLFFLRILLE